MDVVHFTAEELGVELPQYLKAALIVHELYDGTPVRQRDIAVKLGKSRRTSSFSTRRAQHHGLIRRIGTARNTGYVPTEAMEGIAREEAERHKSKTACSLGGRPGRKAGAA